MPKIVESSKANVHQINTKVSETILMYVEKYAKKNNITKSELIRIALNAMIEHVEKKERLMSR